jgi:hypothetical protein
MWVRKHIQRLSVLILLCFLLVVAAESGAFHSHSELADAPVSGCASCGVALLSCATEDIPVVVVRPDQPAGLVWSPPVAHRIHPFRRAACSRDPPAVLVG